MPNLELNCPYVGRCGGCSWGDRPHAEQVRAKLMPIQAEFPTAQMTYAPSTRVRDRVDLVWERASDGQMRLGLYALATDPAAASRQLVDLESCVMMSEQLETWFKAYRQVAPPGLTRGSLRLRVSPAGERGVWLDFANQDVKTLFEERQYLEWLSKQAVVEIGQRRKSLAWVQGAPKLIDPVLRPWFETYGADGAAIPLYGPVGGFTQVGFSANRALVEAVAKVAEQSGVNRWLELFSGHGNFALALAARGAEVEALELEDLAVAGLERSRSELPPEVRERVTVSRLDVYLKTASLPPIAERGLLVDPPRAGLREVLQHIEAGWRPRVVLYVSCFAESFLADSRRLTELGYVTRTIRGVDQFPFTPHGEWVALFEAQ